MYRKNTAGQSIYFGLVNASTGIGLTGASVTVFRALDSGSQIAATGTVTELGNGQYRFNLSQADTNANYGSYLFTATSAVPVEKTVVFTAANPTDAATFGLTNLAILSGGPVLVNQPVTATGALRPIVIGDDYLAANGRAFVWTISAIAGITPGTATAYFGGTSTGNPTHTFLVTGTVTDIGAGKWSVSCEMPRATSSGLLEQQYEWTLGIQASGGNRVTPVRWGERVQAVESHTWPTP